MYVGWSPPFCPSGAQDQSQRHGRRNPKGSFRQRCADCTEDSGPAQANSKPRSNADRVWNRALKPPRGRARGQCRPPRDLQRPNHSVSPHVLLDPTRGSMTHGRIAFCVGCNVRRPEQVWNGTEPARDLPAPNQHGRQFAEPGVGYLDGDTSTSDGFFHSSNSRCRRARSGWCSSQTRPCAGVGFRSFLHRLLAFGDVRGPPSR
jgi:hypothetical protein